MGDAVVEIENLFDILGGSRVTAEERKNGYNQFEKLKNQPETFTVAREVIRRKKSEGAVYTALLLIDHSICNDWDNTVKRHDIQNIIIEICKQTSELNSSLVLNGVSKPAYNVFIRNAKFFPSFQSNFLNSSLLNVELYFCVLEKLTTALMDLSVSMKLEDRDFLREYLESNNSFIYQKAFEKISMAHMDNEPYSKRVIGNIYSSISCLLQLDVSWFKFLLDYNNLSCQMFSLSFLLLDSFNHSYQASIVSFLRHVSEKLIFRSNFEPPVQFFISRDKIVNLCNFLRATMNLSAKMEAANLLFNMCRLITQYHWEFKDSFAKNILEAISAVSINEEPSINVITARTHHFYCLFLLKSYPPLFEEYYEIIVEIFINIVINQKKAECIISYNSIGDDNKILRDVETNIYRFCMSIFTADQQKSAMIGMKYGCKLIDEGLYEDSISSVNFAGIVFALRNISWVTDLGSFNTNRSIVEPLSFFNTLVSCCQNMMQKLIYAPAYTPKQVAYFMDISICLTQYLVLTPALWIDYMKQLRFRCLSLIKFSNDYLSLNLASIYWVRHAAKSLSVLFTAIFGQIKQEKNSRDVLINFSSSVMSVAFEVCLLDWTEREYLQTYFDLRSHLENIRLDHSETLSLYLNLTNVIKQDEIMCTGLSSVEHFLMYFGIGDELIRPEVHKSITQLYRFISLTTTFFTILKSKQYDVNILNNPQNEMFKVALPDIYKYVLRVWECFCGVYDLNIPAPRHPQLIKAIQNSNKRIMECSYEQRFTHFEVIELRLVSLCKNLIKCISSLFIFLLKHKSDISYYVIETFIPFVWKPLVSLPFFILPNFISMFLISYCDIITDQEIHNKFLIIFAEIFNHINFIVISRCTYIRSEYTRLEESMTRDDGNWLDEAYNLTNEVLMALTYFCLRVIDMSSLVNKDIAQFICENIPLNIESSNKFENLLYTSEITWRNLFQLLFTLISFGSSKTVIRICEHSYIQNHIKLRSNEFDKNIDKNTPLVTHMIKSLVTAYKSPHISYQASISIINLSIYIISSFYSLYHCVELTLKQLLQIKSNDIFNEKMAIICSTSMSIKTKKQALYYILNGSTASQQEVESLVNQIEKLSVVESERLRKNACSEDILEDCDLIEIRFLFE